MGAISRGSAALGSLGPKDDKKSSFTPKAYQELKSSIHRDLLSQVDLEKLMGLGDGRARLNIFGIIQELVANSNTPLSGVERDRLSREVLDEVFGLGPLEPLLQDPTINDILVNTYRRVYLGGRASLRRPMSSSRTTPISCTLFTRSFPPWVGAWTSPPRWWTRGCWMARASTS